MFVPRRLRCSALEEDAVAHSGQALRFVDMENRTPSICARAVQQTSEALQHVGTFLRLYNGFERFGFFVF